MEYFNKNLFASLNVVTFTSIFLLSSLSAQAIVRVGGKKVIFECTEEKSDFPKMGLQIYFLLGVHHPLKTAAIFEDSEATASDTSRKELEKITVNRVGSSEGKEADPAAMIVFTDTATQGKEFTLQLTPAQAGEEMLKATLKISTQTTPAAEKTMTCNKKMVRSQKLRMRPHTAKLNG